jgi:hypothetical protein
VEGVTQQAQIGGERYPIIVRHGDQAILGAKPLESLDRIGKWRSLEESPQKEISGRFVGRQAQFLGGMQQYIAHDVASAPRVFFAARKVVLEDVIVGQRPSSISSNQTHAVEDTFFKIDAGPNDIEGQYLNPCKRHWFPLAIQIGRSVCKLNRV